VFSHRVEHHADYVPLPDEIHALEVPKEQAVVRAYVLADGLFARSDTRSSMATRDVRFCCVALQYATTGITGQIGQITPY
jgi:hypothetical protein